MVEEIVMVLTSKTCCRLADLPLVDPSHVWAPDRKEQAGDGSFDYYNANGHPMWFISHAFHNPFSLVVETLKRRFKHCRPEDVFVWLGVSFRLISRLHSVLILLMTCVSFTDPSRF